jgi:hypothetical protein
MGEIFNKLILDPSTTLMISNSSINNIVHQPGSNSLILGLSQNLPLAEAFYKESEKISLEIYYQSIYADIWILTIPKLGSGEKPTLAKIEEMPLSKAEQFLQ